MNRVVVDFFLCKRGGEAGKEGFSANEKKAWRKIWCGFFFRCGCNGHGAFRDGSALTTSIIAIRDNINAALQATLIQRVECNSANDILITTMDTVKATSLNSKISQFLHLIPGTTTVQLDSLSAQLLVHGIPTSYSLSDIGKELTTYNTGLALALQPR